MPFLHRQLANWANQPLTEDGAREILKAAHYTLRYRFEHMMAVDRTEQEYYVCPKTQLATMTVQHFRTALTEALSFRV